MVNLDIHLDAKPVDTPDAEFKVRNALRILAEMVVGIKMVEASGNDDNTPVVDLPQVSSSVPSPPDNSKVLEV